MVFLVNLVASFLTSPKGQFPDGDREIRSQRRKLQFNPRLLNQAIFCNTSNQGGGCYNPLDFPNRTP